ncbi:MAG: site-specific integrase [Propionicimonas sp.]|uniref:tyrosine-type recombinase/integrase n=1 Tax=Propionicimonas sp. TaxID=1955623 RepID=UPI003D14A0EE
MATRAKGSARRSWGRARQERSGRWSAGYTVRGQLHKAPGTFASEDQARAWLAAERRLLDLDAWTAPAEREAIRETERAAAEAEQKAAGTTFAEYAAAWMARRTDPAGARPLAPLTGRDYRTLLDLHLIPAFGALPLVKISPDTVDRWWRRMGTDRPRQRAKAYALLGTICNAAVKDRNLPAVTSSPCQVEGALRRKRRTASDDIEPATLEQLDAIREATPEQYRTMIDLGAWCALRFGELAELRRKDVRLTSGKDGKLTSGVLLVRRGVTFTAGAVHNARTKTEAGDRNVTIPPHLLAAIAGHLADHVAGVDPDALLFPAPGGGYLRQGTFTRWWYKARRAAGRDDLRFHDLRHTGLTLAAQAGATTRELMDRAGHTTPAMAMIYQHSAAGRDAQVAAALSKIAVPEPETPAAADPAAAAVRELAELVDELRQIIADQARENVQLRAQLADQNTPAEPHTR